MIKKIVDKIQNIKTKQMEKIHKVCNTKKIPAWLLALTLITIGIAGAIGYGYQKVNDDGINGTINIISSQAIGIHSARFIGWHDDDVSAATISDDGLYYIFGLNFNNGDEYQTDDQHIEMAFQNYAKTEIIIKLTTQLSVTHPDQADSASDDIHIWYGQDGSGKDNTIGQIDPWTYVIKLQPYSVVINENVAIGDGTTKTFYLDNSPVMHDSQVIYVDGVVNGTENYTFDAKEGIITFHRAPQAPDLIVDADGDTSSTWGAKTDIGITEGHPLELFENVDLIRADSLTSPKRVWRDTNADGFWNTLEPIILTNDTFVDGVTTGPYLSSDLHWKFHDNNDDTTYQLGEDIILEGDTIDAVYYKYQVITADYHWSGEKIRMNIDIGNTVVPGNYEFSTYIEPTNWENLKTVNM